MAKNNKNKDSGLVFSTNPDYLKRQQAAEEAENELNTPAENQQKLRVQRDAKQRGGKEVSVVRGFEGKEEDLEALGKRLKTACGVGGSAKEGEIIIQGNQVDKIVALLLSWGYTQTKKSGG